jgi:hypothetical protein
VSEALYTRLDFKEVSRLYATMVVQPTENSYQIWVDDTLTHADPLGLVFYIEEGQFTKDMGYKDLALALDLPIPYIIGFDIAWSGEDPETQVVAADLHREFGFNSQDPDFWHGSADGARCRQQILLASRR